CDFAGARVLLAEDNKMNMEIAKAILSSWDITVDEAWDGQEAVDMFCSSPAGTYKAILMDIHMPKMDGYSATQTIRASSHPEASSVPIIAMTADVFAEDVSKAMSAGMSGHIGKPIDNDMLFDIMRKCCG
ncbi:MAG: response regulator, partial [Synergistaceae bacterium]|nr:response regulator [Synergistaceae bacterium]